jgi:hypothetical protein
MDDAIPHPLPANSNPEPQAIHSGGFLSSVYYPEQPQSTRAEEEPYRPYEIDEKVRSVRT